MLSVLNFSTKLYTNLNKFEDLLLTNNYSFFNYKNLLESRLFIDEKVIFFRK